MSMLPLLEVKDLRVSFHTDYGVVRAVDGVSFTVKPGRSLGIVGESGCGKSVTSLAVMGLIQPPGKHEGGKIYLYTRGEKTCLTDLNPKGREIRAIRGNEMAMIFQEPMTSLNPVFTIGSQIMESIVLHQRLSKKEARMKAIQMLRKVGIPMPEQRVDAYPHQLSGGMLQRAMIAMALSCRPALLIADEPTTSLDVTIQAQVLDLMKELQAEFKTAIILITHDLGVVAGGVDEVVVMYLGRIMEKSDVYSIFHAPKHPYTQGLMASMPSITTTLEHLKPIEGSVPNPLDLPSGCPFEPRCRKGVDICRRQIPPLLQVASDHWVSCWLYHKGDNNSD
ncbi:MAG: ABC transporter ATP-binding protein [Desulfobacterales bacterium]|nr:MAG: ABC transporter ATP-binding protein [Desulfobacterales bacterium]